MFRLETPEYFYALIIIPVLFMAFYLFMQWKKRDFATLAAGAHFQHLIRGFNKYKSWLRFSIWLLAMFFLILALTNPQYGGRKEKVKVKSSDIILALDISNSMLAEDIAPSRLERAKRFSSKLVRSLRGERIGLILFAGQAYLQMPLTTDYAASELFINMAHPDMAGTQGTSFTEVIKLAMQTFDPTMDHQKVLIIISDGEDHEENALKMVDEAIPTRITIYTVSVGSEEGAYIPMVVRGRKEFKTNEHGEPVITRVNEAFLEEIAVKSGGRSYSILQENSAIQDLKSQMDRLAKREMEQESFTDFNSYYQYLLFIGVVLLILEYLIPEMTKKHGFAN